MTAIAPAPAKALADAFGRKRKKYREMIRGAAAGTLEIDPAAFVELAESIGKTAHDAQQDIERVAARMEAHRRLREAEGLEKQLRELNAAELAAATEFDRIAAAHAVKVKAFREQRSELEREVMCRRNDHRRVFHPDECPYGDLAEELQQALSARMVVIRQIEEFNRQAYKLRQQIEYAEAKHRENIPTPELDVPQMKRTLEDACERASVLEAERREHDAEVDRLDRLMLEP